MQEILRQTLIEGTVPDAVSAVALYSTEERQIPAGVAGGVEYALSPATVHSAVMGEDAAVDIQRIIQPGNCFFAALGSRAFQHKCHFAQISGNSSDVGIARSGTEVLILQTDPALFTVDTDCACNIILQTMNRKDLPLCTPDNTL